MIDITYYEIEEKSGSYFRFKRARLNRVLIASPVVRYSGILSNLYVTIQIECSKSCVVTSVFISSTINNITETWYSKFPSNYRIDQYLYHCFTWYLLDTLGHCPVESYMCLPPAVGCPLSQMSNSKDSWDRGIVLPGNHIA